MDVFVADTQSGVQTTLTLCPDSTVAQLREAVHAALRCPASILPADLSLAVDGCDTGQCEAVRDTGACAGSHISVTVSAARFHRPLRRREIRFPKLPVWAQEDRGCVLAAVTCDPHALQHVPKSLLADRDFFLEVLSTARSAPLLQYAPPALQADPQVVVAAARLSSGRDLLHADPALRRDKAFALELLDCTEHILEYLHETLRGDREVVLKSVGVCRNNVLFVQEPLLRDAEVVAASESAPECPYCSW